MKKRSSHFLGRFVAVFMTVVLITMIIPFSAKAEEEKMVKFILQLDNVYDWDVLNIIVEQWYAVDEKTNITYRFTVENNELVTYFPATSVIKGVVYGTADTPALGYRHVLSGSLEVIVGCSLYVHWYMDENNVLQCIFNLGSKYTIDRYIENPTKPGYTFLTWKDVDGNNITKTMDLKNSQYSTGNICSRETYFYATWKEHEHQWDVDEWTYDENAHWHECLVEGCSIPENSQKDGYEEHQMSDWTVVNDAQFREDGLKRRECQVCDYEEEKIIPKLSDSHIHDFNGETEVVKEPKCYETGLKYVYCTLEECGAYEEQAIDKVPHDYEEDWRYSDVIHYHKCKNCEATADEELHEMTEWQTVDVQTYSVRKLEERHCIKCEYCEERTVEETVPEHNHEYTGREEIVKEPTCTQEGMKRVYCNDEECESFIEKNIPNTEHDYEVGWIHNEEIHYHKCKNCEHHIDDEEHDMFETNMVKLATKDSPGIMELECVRCGYVAYEEVPYVEESNDEEKPENEIPPFTAPQTSDINVVHIYATVAMISGMAYLLYWFNPVNVCMSKEKKEEIVDKLIKWAKSRNRLVKGIALVGISIVLFYYHFMEHFIKRDDTACKPTKIL